MLENTPQQTEAQEANPDFDAVACVTEFLRVISLFGDLLTQETQLLRQAKFEDAKALKDEKDNMAKLYQSLVETMAAHRAQIKEQISDDLRQNVIFARTEFTGVLHKNMEAIENAKKTSQRIINRIIDSAREATSTDPNYNARGVAQNATQNAISISIDQNC